MTTQKALRTLINLMQDLRRIDPEFPLQYILCLCEIARCKNMSLTELAQATGIPLSTTSRIISTLADTKGRCAGLVTVRFSATESRRKELALSAKGATLLTNLTCGLETMAPQRETA